MEYQILALLLVILLFNFAKGASRTGKTLAKCSDVN